MNTAPIQVLIVDDHTLMREGIASMLRNIEDIHIMATASSGEEAINIASAHKPDVILMDIMMGGMTGIEATRWIKEQSNTVKIIIVSMEVKRELISAGIKSGIDGYLPKDSDKETLVDAIRTVHRGGRYFNEAITSLIFEDFYTKEVKTQAKARPLKTDLTKREMEVLELVATGRTNKEVADALFVSVKTVETHKTHILEKLGLKNTAELVMYAVKNKIIQID
jgi:DNA-binding NarL/FixJ family response regulator